MLCHRVTGSRREAFNQAMDMRAMYRGNYAGEFNASNTYMVTSDIDLYEENFVVADHQILTFRGTFDGGGHRIMNHGGQLFSRFASGSTLKNVVFMDFITIINFRKKTIKSQVKYNKKIL